MKHQNEQQKLKGLVRELERELSQEKSQVKVLEETQERLQQAESICQELANENRGLREEIADGTYRRRGACDLDPEAGLIEPKFSPSPRAR